MPASAGMTKNSNMTSHLSPLVEKAPGDPRGRLSPARGEDMEMDAWGEEMEEVTGDKNGK